MPQPKAGSGPGAEPGQYRRGPHDGDGHSHLHTSVDADRRWLSFALSLFLAFMAVEVVIGLAAHSLALITDAAHMLTDAAALALALVAVRLAARPPKGGYTYGLRRAEILSAQANGLTLLLLAAWLTYEAIRRLVHPPDVAGGAVLATAIAGIAVNLLATWCVGKANRTSLNVEGAYQHVLNDLFAFIATAIAGLIIVTTGFARADGIASLVTVALMVKAGAGLVRESWRIFLEAAPAGLDPAVIGHELATQDDVVEVHDLHVWQVTSGYPAASAHVLVEPGGDCHDVRRSLEQLLHDRYGIEHTTLQVDHAEPTLLEISDSDAAHPTHTASEGGEPHCADSHGPSHRAPH